MRFINGIYFLFWHYKGAEPMGTTEVKAILFDTRSIQRYIFSGNKLRTNIGASYIVDHIFDVELAEVLERMFGADCDLHSWRQADADFSVLTSSCRVAYIGGGNALILFQPGIGDEKLKDVIGEFTEVLLLRYPGLRTGAAIGKLDVSMPESYRADESALHRLLKQYQNTISPQVNVAYTGLTQACDVNDEAANYYLRYTPDNKPRFISQEVAAKILAAKDANRELKDRFRYIMGDYLFPEEVDKLGQKEPVNDIAIVHIDGNNMGVKFNQCQTLGERVTLSKAAKQKTENSFAVLLQEIVSEYADYQSFLDLVECDGTAYLPIRPLILGGDDVTFVCAARMAIVYAKRFMEIMLRPDAFFPKGIDSCGGVAIMPTAYPFFRGYELAEQLCDEAKKRCRKEPGTSWLDFAILHGEQAPTLDQIRVQEYVGVLGNLHFGPYKVNDPAYHYSLDKLLQCTVLFNAGKISAKDTNGRGLAKNKIKGMRDILQRGPHDIHKFIEQMKRLDQKLPAIAGWEVYEEKLWDLRKDKYRTPYIDAIELMDYMPGEGQ
jgi:hypothetical protein